MENLSERQVEVLAARTINRANSRVAQGVLRLRRKCAGVEEAVERAFVPRQDGLADAIRRLRNIPARIGKQGRMTMSRSHSGCGSWSLACGQFTGARIGRTRRRRRS